MNEANYTDTIIIGGSAAGLASASCLKQNSIPFILLEQYDQVGMEWIHRYDRLHLHTPKNCSELPHFKMPASYQKYVSKNDFVKYLELYSETLNIKPLFNKKVIRLQRSEDKWEVFTTSGKFISNNVIVATGYSRKPIYPIVKGIENFKGQVIHSSQYKNGESFNDKKVLVVGFGNSACEIAIDLYEHKAFPSLSVRNAVNIIPRDIGGISIINIVLAQSWLTNISPALTDAVNKPILNSIYGDYKKYGLKKLPYGPITQVMKYKKIPLLDIGTINLIKKGKIKVYPDIDFITNDSVNFSDGKEEKFDAIIFATGYHHAVSEFIHGIDTVPQVNNMPNLYFCGFNLSANGMLREIGIEARKIAKAIAATTTVQERIKMTVSETE